MATYQATGFYATMGYNYSTTQLILLRCLNLHSMFTDDLRRTTLRYQNYTQSLTLCNTPLFSSTMLQESIAKTFWSDRPAGLVIFLLASARCWTKFHMIMGGLMGWYLRNGWHENSCMDGVVSLVNHLLSFFINLAFPRWTMKLTVPFISCFWSG